MGCDIHAMIEARHEPKDGWGGDWHCCGSLKIVRNYELFALLGGARNYGNSVTPIGKDRFTEDQLVECDEDYWDVCSEPFCVRFKKWGEDGHSHSWVTLDELRQAACESIDVPELSEKADAIVRAHGFDPVGENARLVFFFDN